MDKLLNPNYVNTSEAYSGKIRMINEYMVIPYININLMKDNPISYKNCFLDYSYYIIQCPYLIEIHKHMIIHNNYGFSEIKDYKEEYIVIHDYPNDMNTELRILCKEIILALPDGYTIGTDFREYVPYNTPNLLATMDKQKVESFFNNNLISENLIELLQ